MMHPRTFVPLALAAAVLASCKGDPQTSYCEATCDYAVTCAETEREVDADALRSSCMSATEAEDATCVDAAEGLDPASGKLLTECTDAVEGASAAGQCEAFVGTLDEIKTGTAEAACASQGTDFQKVFEAAQDSVTETNDQLCDRFTDTFCQRTQDCIVEDVGDIPQDVSTAMGGMPYDLCLERVDFHTSSCKTDGLYAPEEAVDDVNLARQSARDCMNNFETLSCDDLLAGNLAGNQFCASSVADPVAFGAAIAGLFADVVAAMP